VVHRLGPGTHVDGVGVGQERAAAGLPEVVHHPAHVDGADEGGVAPLAEMELHPDQGPLLLAPDDALDLQGLQEPLEFLEIGLLDAGPEIHEEYLAGHVSPRYQLFIDCHFADSIFSANFLIK